MLPVLVACMHIIQLVLWCIHIASITLSKLNVNIITPIINRLALNIMIAYGERGTLNYFKCSVSLMIMINNLSVNYCREWC